LLERIVNSLIIPVYKNEENIPALMAALAGINAQVKNLEVVFVVDGSPDRSYELLAERIPQSGLHAQLLLLSRNFGSYSAIRAGLQAGRGMRFAVMAADLQEPPELVIDFFRILETENIDVVIGTRESRSDPFFSRLASSTFWRLYRFVVPEIPSGGVDVFGFNFKFRDAVLRLDESHSSLVALLFWMGFRRKLVSYRRLPRLHGRSAWTLRRKYIYFKDSMFSFTDLPIRMLTGMGTLGVIFSLVMSVVVVVGRLVGWVNVPGYSATVLTIIFFGALNLMGLGIIGTYAWRTYENTKRRPHSIVMEATDFHPNANNLTRAS
jgi:polyisoprenyl-phosphate glycosyltransferase